MSSVSHSYRYNFESDLTPVGQSSGLQLRLASSGGPVENPYFFDGVLAQPQIIAQALLLLSTISRSRFFSPSLIRERMIASADPVVTCDGERLRFEVFSVCCGMYARLDLANRALSGNYLSKGTTNVDFNPSMRTALFSVSQDDLVRMRVGTQTVELHLNTGSVVERKVKLPVRWLRSFVEVQSHQSSLSPKFEFAALELEKLLLPLAPVTLMDAGSMSYINPTKRGFRLSQRSSEGAVGIGAIARLKVLEPLLTFASMVRLYSSEFGVSAAVLDLPIGTLHVVLSANAARGFSGEGRALADLSVPISESVVNAVRAKLTWQKAIDICSIARDLRLAPSDIENALSVLGSRGLVGYDLDAGYFHRELPFDIQLVEELHPRLQKARILSSEGAVTLLTSKGAFLLEAKVVGDSAEYLVRITDDSYQCTCNWSGLHGMNRGPCSHVLAAELTGKLLD